MHNKKYIISDECIGCQACIGVAPDNFEMGKDNKAYLKKQPKTEKEIQDSNQAIDICPVGAISIVSQEDSAIQPVFASANIKTVLDKNPGLIKVLIGLSPKFERLQKPTLYNSLARFASFKDAAKLTGVSICAILHTINEYLGVSEELIKNAPECISSHPQEETLECDTISWKENNDRYIFNHDTLDELTEKIIHLKAQENIVIISVEYPISLLKVVKGLNFKFDVEQGREYRISIFNPKPKEKVNWFDRKDEFDVLDVRKMTSDPFDIIIKKAYDTEEDEGFKLIQQFEPIPIINMLKEMGFEYITQEAGPHEVWVYFHKLPTENKHIKSDKKDKPDVVIQSATPVAYPVIMRLLQSNKLKEVINIKELKVWEETEKHLGWIVNGKADISFSALITSSKLIPNDIKVPALFVWDNFSILTRGYQANKLEDLIGHDIETPLFSDAPPAKITKYIIEAKGLNYKDFSFKYGEPFGRPEEIFINFVRGDSDTVILREPEASYALKAMEKMDEKVSVLSYNKIWNELNKGFGSFPNAGIVFKGEFTRKYPSESQAILDELKAAIDWVNEHQKQAANLSFDMMRQSPESIELFLNRVHFEYVSGNKLVEKVKHYFDILSEQNIMQVETNAELLNMFLLP